jgi:hypothetical protein
MPGGSFRCTGTLSNTGTACILCATWYFLQYLFWLRRNPGQNLRRASYSLVLASSGPRKSSIVQFAISSCSGVTRERSAGVISAASAIK